MFDLKFDGDKDASEEEGPEDFEQQHSEKFEHDFDFCFVSVDDCIDFLFYLLEREYFQVDYQFPIADFYVCMIEYCYGQNHQVQDKIIFEISLGYQFVSSLGIRDAHVIASPSNKQHIDQQYKS